MFEHETTPDALAAGAVLDGRYRIEQEIARGGMGVIYRATHMGLELPRAIKLITPEYARDREHLERFHHEVTAAASIAHPHVVAVHDSGEIEGRPYLVMEYVDGVDLQRLIDRDGALDRGRALELLSQIAGALDAAHAIGVVHRDVKPSNILVISRASGEHALLTDFGVAEQLKERSQAASELWGGTLEYASPEQVDGRTVDARTDVYSLACVLHHALTGRRPGAPQLHKPLPPLHGDGFRLPDELDTVIARAREHDPERRYASAGELMRAALAATGQGAEPTVLRRPRSAPPDYERVRPSGVWRRWQPWALAALAGALVIALAGGGGTLVVRNASALWKLTPPPSQSPDPSPTPTRTATPSPTGSPNTTPTPPPTATPSATPTATPWATPTATPPSAPTTTPPRPDDALKRLKAVKRRNAERAVTRHWRLRERGDYAAAYHRYSPALQARTPRSGWIASLKRDGLYRVEIDVDARLTSATTAAVTIKQLRTVAAASGCHTWTGSYDVQRIAGVWRISAVHLRRHGC